MNIVSKYIGSIKLKYKENKLSYIDDLISLYKDLMDNISAPIKAVDSYYLKISELRDLGQVSGFLATISDDDFNEMFRKSKIAVLENAMKKDASIQEYANYINFTLKNDNLAHNLGLKFDDDIATAENTMNNYIVLKKNRRLLTEEQNTRKR